MLLINHFNYYLIKTSISRYILYITVIQAEFILDVFDADISPEMLSMYDNDEIPVSSTPYIINNLSATPDQVNHIARTIQSQFDYLNPAFDEMTFSLDNAAGEFKHFI